MQNVFGSTQRNVRFCALAAAVACLVFRAESSEAAGVKPRSSKELAKAYEQVIERNAVENLIGRYVYYHLANMLHDPIYLELFADGDPDLKIVVGRGLLQGPDAIRRYIGPPKTTPQGGMYLHPLSTPVIEVAGDLQTAQGVWVSDGVEAHVQGDGTSVATSLVLKFCVDFKKINGAWKIWHLNTYPLYKNDLGGPWAPVAAPADPNGVAPNRMFYSPSTVQTLTPVPPLPYQTWDNSMSCVK